MKLLKALLCGCMVAVASSTMVGCGDAGNTAEPAANPAPPPAADTGFSKDDSSEIE